MANLTNTSLQTEEALEEWWMPNTVPKFKKDQKYECDLQLSADYRKHLYGMHTK